jgi:hypothetical protein
VSVIMIQIFKRSKKIAGLKVGVGRLAQVAAARGRELSAGYLIIPYIYINILQNIQHGKSASDWGIMVVSLRHSNINSISTICHVFIAESSPLWIELKYSPQRVL